MNLSIDRKTRAVTATSKEKKGVYFVEGDETIETEKLIFSLKQNGDVSIVQK